MLGHHSTGKHSHEIYNRDLLAEPIRGLELILQRIRTGAFLLPDASRSGMIAEPNKEDPSNKQTAPVILQEAVRPIPQVIPTLCIQINTRMTCMTLCLRKKDGTQTSNIDRFRNFERFRNYDSGNYESETMPTDSETKMHRFRNYDSETSVDRFRN